MTAILKVTGKDKEIFEQAAGVVLSEIEYAQKLWETDRPKTTLDDNEKPLECWLTWARREIELAIEKGYYSYNKKEALEHVRKAAGHLLRAIAFFMVPGRTEYKSPQKR